MDVAQARTPPNNVKMPTMAATTITVSAGMCTLLISAEGIVSVGENTALTWIK
jgi:hypothetical protein